MTPLRLLAISPLLALLSCTTVPGEADVDLEDCAGDADVDDVTYIAWDFETSAHEMIVCGGLTSLLVVSLIESANTFGTNPDALPDAFSFAEGLYNTQGTGVSMDLWLEYGPDSPGGTPGDLVAHNLFDPDSFLSGADASDNEDGTVTLSFDEPGPLAAFLGRGEDPESPLLLTDADAAVIAANFASLKLAGEIHVDDEVTLSTITYDLANPAALIEDLVLGEPWEMELVGATGSREELSQTATSTTWNIAYHEATKALEGTIELEVRGGPFDFLARYDYLPVSPEPAVSITCLD